MVGLMKSFCFSFIILASFATLFNVADARSFNVGGTGDWVVKPNENYNTWAERNRFQVNDTLYFKYANRSDSVLRVVKTDYEGCNIKNPKEKFENGVAKVTLNRSGPFYFISGNKDHCLKGLKLIVVVLAERNQPKVPISPAKAPSTAQPPKAHTPVSPVAPAKAPSTAQPPKSHSPASPIAPAKAPSSAKSPKSHSPVSPPAKAPSTAESPKSHSPVSPPAKAPSTAQSPKSHSPVSPPAKAPSTAEPPKAHSPASPTTPAKAPSASSPAKPPTSSPSPDQTPASPAPENTPPSSPTPAADIIKAPAPSPKSAASGVAVTSVLTTVLSLAFTVLMFA